MRRIGVLPGRPAPVGGAGEWGFGASGRRTIEADARHRGPAGVAADETPDAAQAEDEVDLAIAEILENGGRGQPGQIRSAWRAPQLLFLQCQRSDAHRRSEQESKAEEGERHFPGKQAHPPQERDGEIADQLERRAEHVLDESKRHRHGADAAVAGIAQHAPVTPKRFQPALLPSRALIAQACQRLGRFGPADDLRHEIDAIGAALLAHMAVDADNELEILADRVMAIAADFDQDGALEDAERTRNQGKHAHVAVGDTRGNEGAHIFHDLEAREPAGRYPYPFDVAAADGGAVHHPDGAADRHQPPIVIDEGFGGSQQPVGLDDGIGVDDADERLLRKADAGIGGIRLAAILLVHDEEVRISGRAVDAEHAGSLQRHRLLTNHR